MNIPRFHLAFPVNDIESTRDFYVDMLCCKLGRVDECWIDFDFFGHQLSAHVVKRATVLPGQHFIDGEQVPVPHFGVILDWLEWERLRDRLKLAGIDFTVEPTVRFKGEVGEQATLFIKDPSGNCLEFKAFRDQDRVFSS